MRLGKRRCIDCGNSSKPPGRCEIETGYINQDTVQVWPFQFSALLDKTGTLCDLLSDEELEKAAGYKLQKRYQHSVISRALLRKLLARYTRMEPTDIQIANLQNGKPFISSNTNSLQMDFNISHSDDWIVLAFGTNRQVGVDIEKMRSDIDYRSIASRYFSIHDVNEIDRASDAGTLSGMVHFYRLWTCKEARVKCEGTTLFDIISRRLGPPCAALGDDLPDHSFSGSYFCDEQGFHYFKLQIIPDYSTALVTDRHSKPVIVTPERAMKELFPDTEANPTPERNAFSDTACERNAFSDKACGRNAFSDTACELNAFFDTVRPEKPQSLRR